MPMPEPAGIPIFVLCGGQGSRMGEVAAQRPKPMLDIGEKPMLLHIMGCYARFGFRADATSGLWLPGPVERGRFLAKALKPSAANDAGTGPVLPLAA